MAGQGILIIVIPNDLNNEQEKSLDVAQVRFQVRLFLEECFLIQIVKDPSELPSKSTDLTSNTEHSKEYPCSACGPSLTSRFRHHISPKLNLVDAIWVKIGFQIS